MYIKIFRAALFIRAKNGKQHKHPSTTEYIVLTYTLLMPFSNHYHPQL